MYKKERKSKGLQRRVVISCYKEQKRKQFKSSCKLYILSPKKGVFTCPTIFAQGGNRIWVHRPISEAQQQ